MSLTKFPCRFGKYILLDRINSEKLLTPRGVYGFWPANRDGDDIVVWGDEARSREQVRFHMLRQQATKPNEQPYFCLSDFVAPASSGLRDHIGAFAVTTGEILVNCLSMNP